MNVLVREWVEKAEGDYQIIMAIVDRIQYVIVQYESVGNAN